MKVTMIGCTFTENGTGISSSGNVDFDIADTNFNKNGIAFQINDKLEFPGKLVDLIKDEIQRSIKEGEMKQQTVARLSKLEKVKQFADKHAINGAMLLTALTQLYVQVTGG